MTEQTKKALIDIRNDARTIGNVAVHLYEQLERGNAADNVAIAEQLTTAAAQLNNLSHSLQLTRSVAEAAAKLLENR